MSNICPLLFLIGADLGQFLLSATIGQESIVADPHDVQGCTNAANWLASHLT